MDPRDDQAALESRRDELRRRLDEATRKADELRRATQGREALEEELARVEDRLAQRRGRRLPVLEDVRIASPCTASWEAMTGDDRVRFCGECKKNVYNLSAMASEEAERLLAAREGSICVRLYQRDDGTVLTADCPVGARRRRRRRVAIAFAGAGAMAATSAFAATFAVQGEPNLAEQAVEQVPVTSPPPPPTAPVATSAPSSPIAPTMGALPPRHLMGRPSSTYHDPKPPVPQGPRKTPRKLP